MHQVSNRALLLEQCPATEVGAHVLLSVPVDCTEVVLAVTGTVIELISPLSPWPPQKDRGFFSGLLI